MHSGPETEEGNEGDEAQQEEEGEVRLVNNRAQRQQTQGPAKEKGRGKQLGLKKHVAIKPGGPTPAVKDQQQTKKVLRSAPDAAKLTPQGEKPLTLVSNAHCTLGL